MTTLAPSFLICSSLFLQVTRTTIKSRMGSKFGRIRVMELFLQITIKVWMGLNFGKISSLTLELAALERQKN